GGERAVEVVALGVTLDVQARAHPRFDRPLETNARPVCLLNSPPWVRSLGKLPMDVSAQGWRFPLPPDQPLQTPPRQAPAVEAKAAVLLPLSALPAEACVDLPAAAAAPSGAS